MSKDALRVKVLVSEHEADMTQDKLADLLKVSRSTITRWSRYGFTGIGGRANGFLLQLLSRGIIEEDDFADYYAGRPLRSGGWADMERREAAPGVVADGGSKCLTCYT
jgi:hypothetical protein